MLLLSKYRSGLFEIFPGGTPLYKPSSYVPPQRVGFLGRFGLNERVYILPIFFLLESGIVFEGRMNVFVV